MLIQNLPGNPLPASPAPGGNAGAPAPAVPAAQTGSTPVVLPQVAVPQAGNTQAAPPSNAQLQSAIDRLNQAMLQSNTALEFSIDSSTGRALVKVVDAKTGETIKQFPSEEAIAISKAIDQFQKGMLLRQKA
jgi:flagellar protein FlaG